MEKLKLLFCLLVLVLTTSFANGQTWLWGRQGNFLDSLSDAEAWALAADYSGNAYLTGYYTGNKLVFGADTLINTVGSTESFLVKYSPAGNVLWAKQSETVSPYGSGQSYSVATDMQGNSYITGNFNDTIKFGSYMLTSDGAEECFLVKYSANGNVLWAKQSNVPSVNSEGVTQSVCTDKNGNVFITGYFADTVVFGSFQLNTPYATLGIFTVKYDLNGNVLWAKQSTGASLNALNEAYGVASDGIGNIYVTGNFGDTTSFGTYTLTTPKSHYSYSDFFLVKYNSAGSVLWAKQATVNSGRSFGIGWAVTIDKAYNAYITGFFNDTLSIGSKKIISKYFSLFVAKFDSGGNAVWAKSATILDSSSWEGDAISIDTNGNLYIAADGNFGGAHNYKVAFGADTFKAYVGADDGASLIIRLDTSGKLLCGAMVAGGGDDQNGMAVDPSGDNVYFGGDFADPTIFGPDTLTDIAYQTHPFFAYEEYPFIAKWQPCNNTSQGINGISFPKYSVSVYPNPGSGQFNFVIASEAKQSLTIEVYNLLGEKVYSNYQITKSSNYQIDLSSQPNGVYLYRVISETGNLIGQGKLAIAR